MPSLQTEIDAFIHANGLTCAPATRALDLASEFGEVAKEILKSSDYGKQEVVATDDLREELGDLTFSLYALAAEMGIDLAGATRGALAKYQTRLITRGDASSGR